MAVPTVRANGAQSTGTTGAVTVAAPAGVATGDLEILVSSTIAGGSVVITTNGGSAWTVMPNTPIDVTAGEKLYAWYRVRQGGDGDPQVTPGSDHSMSHRTAVTTGTFNAAAPIEIAVTSSEVTSDTSFLWLVGTQTTAADRLHFVVCTSGVDSVTGQAGTDTANTSLTSIVLQLEYNTTNGGGGGYWVATGQRLTPGTTGTWTQTMVGATPKSYLSFAVAPVPPAAKTTSTGEVSLATISTPPTRTGHSLKARGRVTTALRGTLRLRLYQGATAKSAEYETVLLSTSFRDYTLPLTAAEAISISDYSDLRIRFRGYSDDGSAAVFEIAELALETQGLSVVDTTAKTCTAGMFSIDLVIRGWW